MNAQRARHAHATIGGRAAAQPKQDALDAGLLRCVLHQLAGPERRGVEHGTPRRLDQLQAAGRRHFKDCDSLPCDRVAALNRPVERVGDLDRHKASAEGRVHRLGETLAPIRNGTDIHFDSAREPRRDRVRSLKGRE